MVLQVLQVLVALQVLQVHQAQVVLQVHQAQVVLQVQVVPQVLQALADYQPQDVLDMKLIKQPQQQLEKYVLAV